MNPDILIKVPNKKLAKQYYKRVMNMKKPEHQNAYDVHEIDAYMGNKYKKQWPFKYQDRSLLRYCLDSSGLSPKSFRRFRNSMRDEPEYEDPQDTKILDILHNELGEEFILLLWW